MHERDHAWPDHGEADIRNMRDDRIAGVRGGRESDYEGAAPHYGGAVMDDEQEFPRDGARAAWSHGPTTQAYPHENEGALPGYARARSAPPVSRFLDDPPADYDEPPPAKESRIRPVWFFLLMAAIGSSAGALWFYFDPDLARYVPGFSSANADRTTELLVPLVEGQSKLTQSVAGMQAAQAALQKNIAAREQELQRLLAETQALRTDINALRSGLPETGLRLHGGQPAKGVPAAAKKAKAERKPAPQQEQPQNESTPTAPPPSQ